MKVIYPTLDVFIYQLGQGLGADKHDITANESAFLDNFPQEIRTEIKQALSQKLSAKSAGFTQLLSNDNYYYPIPSDTFTKNYPDSNEKYLVEGFYYPVNSSDTYGLLFDCSVIPNNEEQPVSSFQNLKKLAPQTKSNLGRIWILSGHCPVAENVKDLAVGIYKVFRSEGNNFSISEIEREWQKHLTGKFLGAVLFWVWLSHDSKQSVLNEQGTLIIIYNCCQPNEEIQKVHSDLNRDWLNLFGFINKIVWAYNQSQDIKQQLETEFVEIRQAFIEIKNLAYAAKETDLNLQQLQSILNSRAKTLSSYAINLSYIEIQLSTIETNLYNYQLCLEHIERQAKQFGETNLDCFREFVEIVINQYKKQIERDYASLSPSLKALENLINQIQSIVELEQGERDRRLENRIAAVGVGVGVASTAASAFSALVKDFTQFYPIKVDSKKLPWGEPLSNLMLVLLFSILFGVVSGRFTLWILDKRRVHNLKGRYRDKS